MDHIFEFIALSTLLLEAGGRLLGDERMSATEIPGSRRLTRNRKRRGEVREGERLLFVLPCRGLSRGSGRSCGYSVGKRRCCSSWTLDLKFTRSKESSVPSPNTIKNRLCEGTPKPFVRRQINSAILATYVTLWFSSWPDSTTIERLS